MLDQCTVYYKTGETTQDETTGKQLPVMAVRFVSKCKVQSRSRLGDSFVSSRQGGGREIVHVDIDIHLPVSAPAVSSDDQLVMTGIGPLSDTHLLNRRFRLVAATTKSYASSRRMPMLEVVS